MEDIMAYANRDSEYNAVKSFLEEKANPIIINAYHASGVTSFVKCKLSDVFSLFFGNRIFYIDATSQKSLAEMLFICLICSEYSDRLQQIADKKLGVHDSSLFSAALAGIPYVGPGLARVTEKQTALPIYSGAYPSVMEEFLVPFFEEYACNGQFLIIIDAVEMLPESSYDLLVKLLRCSKVRIILINELDSKQYDKLENYLFMHEISSTARVDFDRPQIKLVKELGQLYKIAVSTDEAKNIINKTGQNIHSIIKSIRELKNIPPLPPLSDAERAIISILHIWEGPIEEGALVEMVAMSALFSINTTEMCKKALYLLTEREIIINTSKGWEMACHHNPQVQEVILSVTDQLLYRNIVYNFLVHKQSGLCNVELRYQLSKKLDCTTSLDARLYLHQLLVTGKEATSNLIAEAHLSTKKREDCLLAGVKYCRERRYEDAYRWVDSIPHGQMTEDTEAFRAVLLNRIRKNKEAEIALRKSLENQKVPKRKNLLGAVLISTYIHMERLSDAQKIYHSMKDAYPSEPMHGYLVRNVTSAYRDYQPTLFHQALIDFKRDGDDFGYYTTLCNQGYALCKYGNPESALTILEQAKVGLEKFSTVNLHIIYNDLGLCYLLLDKYQKAYHFLVLSYNLARNKMPRIFAAINLACTEAVTGQTKLALHRLDSIETEVRQHPLDRVRQKYFINRLLVEYLSGNRQIEFIIDDALRYLDRYTPEHTKKAVRFYSQFIKTGKPSHRHRWKELFSPCGLAYWYMDPLKLFPEGII